MKAKAGKELNKSMKGLAITNKGIEDISASEIKEIANAKASPGNGFVLFESENFECFFRLCYKSQSIRKVMLILSSFKIKDISDIKSQLQKISLGEWADKESSFVVRSKIRESKIPKQELEAKTGEFIIEKTSAKVDLHTPDTTFFVFIERDECFFGVDFSADDLGKRDYRIFTGKEGIKPNVAYAISRLSGFKPGMKLLDPFCRAGTIAIEAALFSSNFPVNFFGKEKFLFLKLKKFKDYDFTSFFAAEDKKASSKPCNVTAADAGFQAISAAKKNAKIAGIDKQMEFSRKEPEWLDARFKEHELDCIASFPPQKGRSLEAKKAVKLYTQLFYQADYILKEKGIVSLLMRDESIADEPALKYKYKPKQKRKVMQGGEQFFAVVYEKQ